MQISTSTLVLLYDNASRISNLIVFNNQKLEYLIKKTTARQIVTYYIQYIAIKIYGATLSLRVKVSKLY